MGEKMEDKRTTSSGIGNGGTCTPDDTGNVTSTIVDPSKTEWTDEKHSLYLNSIEESFVNQMYNHDYDLNNYHDWVLGSQKNKNSSSTSNRPGLGQFKVQKRGCWEEIKFGRSPTKSNARNETHVLAVNPWIKHFRSSETGHKHERTDHRVASCSKRLLHCPGNVYHEKYSSSITEVSDQNFTDDDCKVDNKARGTSKKKSPKNALTHTLDNDQVVPFRSSLILPSEQVCESLDRKFAGSARQMPKTCTELHMEEKKFWKIKPEKRTCADQLQS